MKGINIFLADGFEDIEALAVNDVLRRGGLKVNLISIEDDPFVVSSHGVTIGAEQFFSDWNGSHAGTGARDFMIFPCIRRKVCIWNCTFPCLRMLRGWTPCLPTPGTMSGKNKKP